tara:strand:+ start:52 stop:192 length:141 start_codon:yes stop_codon:yes gene_type:complete
VVNDIPKIKTACIHNDIKNDLLKVKDRLLIFFDADDNELITPQNIY